MKIAIIICLLFSVTIVLSQDTQEAINIPTPSDISDKDALANALNIKSYPEIEKALADFIVKYPESEHLISARTSLTSIRVNIAEERFLRGDNTAVEMFKKAVEDAPQPIPEKLFNEMLSKIPARLYLGGDWSGAYSIAEALELKIQNNSSQLTSLAGFYLSVEDGGRAEILAKRATEIDATSAAFSALGLANRLQFDFEKAEINFTKAVELQPESSGAKRGLAEIKRALGKYQEAVVIYTELLDKDADDISALTGKILSELEYAERNKVEDDLDAALEKNPQNVQLLAGAAYWYASNNNAEKALDFADLALAVEPRYIWAHIARARGFMLQKKPMEAEKTLLAARKIANFPSLEYEIAKARYDMGLYREAAEDLAKVFYIKEGKLVTKIGGRVEQEADDFISLVGQENKASIFISQKEYNKESSQKLKDLLQFYFDLNSEDSVNIAASAKRFASGSESMKLHRGVFAAESLINKNIALDTALELIQEAAKHSDSASNEPFAVMATMANELYEVRRTAFLQAEYISQPSVPQQTIISIIRGRIEEITGMILQSSGKSTEAAIRYNRALSILPDNSAWSRSVNWRLGIIERDNGNEKKALERFIRSYDKTRPDIVKYVLIETIFTKLNGSSEQLIRLIGPSPLPPSNASQQVDLNPEPIKDPAQTAPEIVTKIGETEESKEVGESNEAYTEKTSSEQKDIKPVFEPIIIGIKKQDAVNNSDSPANNKETAIVDGGCTIRASQENIVLKRNGGSIGVLAGADGNSSVLEITSNNTKDIKVSIENDPAVVTTRTFFVISSISETIGDFEVRLKADCGEKILKVTVK